MRKLTNTEKASELVGSLRIFRSVDDDSEKAAGLRAEQQILEVLDQLSDVESLSQAQKERAAAWMGQYIFDDICDLVVYGEFVDIPNFSLDQEPPKRAQSPTLDILGAEFALHNYPTVHRHQFGDVD